ncbi:hypothetical protein FGO68_gene8592 [Halteria grandinella]|uniref:Uncharacterized protein n=1 Tax=Halteria grandinella TaxID=5974 RepID=A0A8J8SYD9_HALGN|nr:hypothetical protein FGO68_gene8592 [Halteria grandinella]
MSSTQPQYVQDRYGFSHEAFYSLLNDSATDCNALCGAGNQTCFKNCVVKNKQLINTMRNYIIDTNRKETTFPHL